MKYYDKLIFELSDQEDLYELQELVANFALKVAENEGKVEQLVKKFPFLYRKV